MSPTPEALEALAGPMRACIDAARAAHAASGAYPIGSAVVRDGELLAVSGSRLPHVPDPTAHPEIEALRAACASAGSRYLQGAVLVSTVEPCPMCTAAAIWARLDGIAYGVDQGTVRRLAQRDAGLTWRQIDLRSEAVAAAGEPRLWVAGGVLREACAELLRPARAGA